MRPLSRTTLAPFALAACLLLLGACASQRQDASSAASPMPTADVTVAPASSPDVMAPSEAPAHAARDQAGEMPAPCPTKVQISKAEAALIAATSLLDGCHERCMKSGSGRWGDGMKLLRHAARGGSLEAQRKFGKMAFSNLMTTGEEPELEDEYVEAIAFSRLAALRDPQAAGALPGLKALRINADGKLRPALVLPLSTLPLAWVKQGVERGDKMFACYQK